MIVRFLLCILLPALIPLSISAAQGATSYVGSQACSACHLKAYEAWKDSHHGWAWREMKASNVLGDFGGSRFSHGGVDYDFHRDGEGGYRVELRDQASQEVRDYAIAYVAGVAPLQQYLIETEPGRLQSFDVVWDAVGERWYHLYPAQDLPPEDGLHWTGSYKNWNARCAECHATGYEKNYDPKARRYQSRQAEIGVGCEACHGPGEAHLAWAEGSSAYEPVEGMTPLGFSIAFSPEDPQGEIELCAPCHSRREPLGDASPLPGSAFEDHYNLSLLREGLYHPDGQILDEVYVYGSFLQSRMYAEGVQCSDCHEPHGATLKAEGNALCTQCHNPEGRPEFPSLKPADYDSPSHHFHPENSEGAACKSCHMIERVYMGTDGRRDHSFRVPRPDLSLELGTPNACTDCHKGRGDQWALEALLARYRQWRSGSAHFSQVFAAAQAAPGSNNAALLALAEDRQAAVIVRATALELLSRRVMPEEARRAIKLLSEPDPLIRSSGMALLRALPQQERLREAVALLDDPSRSVRIEAARALIDIRGVVYPDAISRKLEAAFGEYRSALFAKADFPEIQQAIGGLALVTGNLPAASQAFAEAVRLDPQLTQAWRMMARIEEAQGAGDAALAALDRGLAANPSDGLLLRTKAEMLAGQGDIEGAAALLEQLRAQDPGDAGTAADLGSLYALLGEPGKAVPLLLEASEAGFNSPDLLYRLGEAQAQLGQTYEARSTLTLMQALHPEHDLTAALAELLSR
ncbi:multiheme c-type cytochrome [Limibacillus halophilus]